MNEVLEVRFFKDGISDFTDLLKKMAFLTMK